MRITQASRIPEIFSSTLKLATPIIAVGLLVGVVPISNAAANHYSKNERYSAAIEQYQKNKQTAQSQKTDSSQQSEKKTAVMAPQQSPSSTLPAQTIVAQPTPLTQTAIPATAQTSTVKTASVAVAPVPVPIQSSSIQSLQNRTSAKGNVATNLYAHLNPSDIQMTREQISTGTTAAIVALSSGLLMMSASYVQFSKPRISNVVYRYSSASS